MKVCSRCLSAIISREGFIPTAPIYEENQTCEWCENDGFDTLYELL